MSLPGIYWMMAFTLLVTTGAWAGVFFIPARSRRKLLWLLLPGLPLSALVNIAIKTPLLRSAAGWLGLPLGVSSNSPWYWIALIALTAPITEELIKVLPLALPAVRKRVLQTPYTALWGGLALGMGFGLGEVIYLAEGIARSPAYAGIPWYGFTGYFSERFLVVLLHGILTAGFVNGFHRGGWAIGGGYLLAVLGHALVNVGAVGITLRVVTAQWANLLLLGSSLVLIALFFWQSRRIAPRAVVEQDADEVILFRSVE